MNAPKVGRPALVGFLAASGFSASAIVASFLLDVSPTGIAALSVLLVAASAATGYALARRSAQINRTLEVLKRVETSGGELRAVLQEMGRSLGDRLTTLSQETQALRPVLQGVEDRLRQRTDQVRTEIAAALESGLRNQQIELGRHAQGLGNLQAHIEAHIEASDQHNERRRTEILDAVRQADVEQFRIRKAVDATRQEVLEILTKWRRELCYIVDLAMDKGEIPAPRKGVVVSQYAADQFDKMKRMVRFAQLAEASRIRELYMREIFPDIDRVTLPVGAVNELSAHPNKVDMLYVCAVAKHRQAREIFEFGTYLGRTTYYLTMASEDAHVTTLNLSPERDPAVAKYLGSYFRGTDRESRITQIFCDSKEFDPAPHCGKYDFIFIDGDHSYDGVKNDTEKAFEMLKPGGTVLWHDYAPKTIELVEYIRDLTQGRPLFRLKRTCLLVHIDGEDPMTFQPHPLIESIEEELLKSRPWFFEEIYHA